MGNTLFWARNNAYVAITQVFCGFLWQDTLYTARAGSFFFVEEA